MIGLRRYWNHMVVLAALLLLGTSCIGGGGNKSAAPAPGKTLIAKEPTSPVKLRFVTHSGVATSPQIQKLADDFHKLNPNITIELENVPFGQFNDKLTTEIAAGTAPDVAYMDSGSIANFASRGALVDVTPYINGSKIVKADNYVPALRASATYNGDMYGLPFDGESTGLFYRTDLFAAAGISGPPTTWTELQADAAKLTDPSKKQYGWIEFAPESAYYWYPFLWQAGGQLLSADGKTAAFDSAQGDQAANFWISLAKYSPPDYYNSNSWDGRVAFANGQVAMYEAGAWFAGEMYSSFPQINGKWASAPLPQGPNGCATTIAGDTLALVNGTKNADAAWLWIEFLSEPQNVRYWNVGGKYTSLLPPLNSLLNDPATFAKKPWLAGFAANMKCGITNTINNPKWPKVEAALNDQLGAAIYGKITPAEALDKAAQQALTILAGTS